MFTTDSYFKLSREIEHHHVLFYMMWEMGSPNFTEDIETAAIEFDEEGERVNFLFNPSFWEKLSDYEKLFIICHECLHVILNHGIRIKDTTNRKACNIALDIVVNHSLVNNFGFDRNQLSMNNDLCWIDTVFPNEGYSDNENFEFYYNKFPKMSKDITPIDDHNYLKDLADYSKQIINKLNESLSNEEKNNVKDFIEKHFEENKESNRGNTAGGQWTFVNVKKVKKKKKWESVIKKWSKKYDKPAYEDVEQWARLNRRFVTLSDDLILPSVMEEEHEEEGKIQVWFFQDTSESCRGYINRFFKAAKSLDPKRFDVKMHCFDTKVYETTLESKKLYGFGGTDFHPMEDYIQKYIKTNNEDYPKAIFVITDGYGTTITPEKPKNWYWFLTTKYDYCIPKECNIFDLKNYE